MRVPTCMDPSWIRKDPNQITATLETFSTSITTGNASAISRPARNAVSVTSSLARANRAVSMSSRTKERTTRMPVSCSRSTRFTVSIRFCICRNSGTIRTVIRPDGDQQHRDTDGNQPGQLDVLPDRHDHPADTQHGRRHQHGGAHQHQLLDLLDVVGGPGDQAGSPESGDFLLGEFPHPGEDGAAEVTAHPHGRFGREVHGDNRAGDLRQRDHQHHRAQSQDEPGIALRHALIDDVRVQGGQVQRRNGLRQLENDDGGQQPAVRPQVFNKQFPQHPTVLKKTQARNERRRSVYDRRLGVEAAKETVFKVTAATSGASSAICGGSAPGREQVIAAARLA